MSNLRHVRWLVVAGAACASEAGSDERAVAIQGGVTDVVDVAAVGISSNNGTTCTGSLIAPNLVVTAQHCVAPVVDIGRCDQGTFGPPGAPGDYFVTTRATLTFNASDYHRVAAIAVPPGGDAFCGRDIVLLRLTDNVSAAEAAAIAPRLESPPAAAETYAAIGFGATDDNGTGSGERRRRDGLAVACVGNACASQFVATAEWNGEAGVCPGDSGGPALAADGRVIGIASRGAVGCIAPTYTEISAHADWLIEEAAGAAAAGGYPPPEWTGIAPPLDAAIDAGVAIDANGSATDDSGGCRTTDDGSSGATAVFGVFAMPLVRRMRRRSIRRPVFAGK